MKAIKRTVAAVLATLMLATSTSFTLAAENYTAEEAVVVAKVNAAGIMEGKDTGFAPADTLTRAEAAAIIVRMKGCESAAKSMAGTTLFKDVAASHWASGYVNEASNLGIVKGVSATEFAPEREVTVAEFATMAIRALGAGQLVDSEGTWPTNYVNFANENDILKDVNAIYTAKASRMNAATIVANTLETRMWEKVGVKSNGEIEWGKAAIGTTILSKTLELVRVTDVTVSDFDYVDHEIDVTKTATTVGISTNLNDVDVKASFDLATLKSGVLYDCYYDEDEDMVLGFWKAESSKTKMVEFTEITKFGGDYIKVSVDGKEKEYDVTATSDFIINNTNTFTDNYTAFKSAVDSRFEKENVSGSIEINGDDVVTLYAYGYTNAGVVDEVTSTRVKFVTVDGKAAKLANASTLKIDDDDLTYNVSKNGKTIEISEIKEDDVVLYYTENAGKVFNMLVLSNSEEGEVTSVGTNYIKLDGKKYTNVALNNLPSTEDKVELYFNESGKVIAWQQVEGSGDFAVLSSLEYYKNKKDSIKLEVTLTFADGTKSEAMTLDMSDDEYTDTAHNSNIEFIKTHAISHVITEAEENDGVVKHAAAGDAGTAVTEDDVVYLALGNYYTTQAAADGVLAGITAVTDFNKAVEEGNSILGSVVKYEIAGSDLYLKADIDSDIAIATATKYTGSTKDYFTLATLNGTADTSKVYLTGSTKVLAVKADTEDEYKVKVSALDVDSLETTSDSFALTFVDIDEDNNASIVVIDERVAKVKKGDQSTDWAIVIDVANTKEDFDKEVTIVYADGEEKVLFTDDTNAKTLTYIGLPTIEGEEITELEAGSGNDSYRKATAATGEFYVTDEKSGVLYLIDYTTGGTITGETSAVLADKVLYIAYDTVEGTYSVGKANEVDFFEEKLRSADITTYTATAADVAAGIKFYDGTNWDTTVDAATTYDLYDGKLYKQAGSYAAAALAADLDEAENNASSIKYIYLYKDEDGDDEIVAIVYNK